MIIFNNAGHCFLSKTIYEDPIVWVDAQDISTYTLSGNDVTNLDNKGTLGGVMTLNGNVKFANNGFESWGSGVYITRDLGETFLPTSSFTIATTFDFQNITQNTSRGWWGNLYANDANTIMHNRTDANMRNLNISSNITSSNELSYQLGLQTLVSSYDVNTNTLMLMNYDGSNDTFTSITYNNVNNTLVYLLGYGGSSVSSPAANNPLHEFRLYNRAMSLVEMQDLQTELNEKYIILGNELVVNGDFSTDSDWTKGSSWTISGGTANSDGTENNGLLRQGILPSGDDKIFRVEFEVLNYVSGEIYPLVLDENGKISGYSTSNGIFSFDGYRFTSGSDLFYMRGVDFIGSIDNISVKEILN